MPHILLIVVEENNANFRFIKTFFSNFCRTFIAAQRFESAPKTFVKSASRWRRPKPDPKCLRKNWRRSNRRSSTPDPFPSWRTRWRTTLRSWSTAETTRSCWAASRPSTATATWSLKASKKCGPSSLDPAKVSLLTYNTYSSFTFLKLLIFCLKNLHFCAVDFKLLKLIDNNEHHNF